MTSLLYSGQLLAKDPISDWFSIEQYSIPAVMAARPGYLDRMSGKPNVVQTRAFLSQVVPALYRLRPLIETGVIILVPSKSYVSQCSNEIDEIATKISEEIGFDIRAFTERFKPRDMALEDNIRGVLVFAGGQREEQIRKALFHSVRHFASEYGLANQYGFHYTAPFEFEAFLCEKGLASIIENSPGARVLHAIFNSRLHLFSGLTPELVASLHDDDNFGLFRSNLFQAYNGIPVTCSQGELGQYLIEAEAAMIEPCLANIVRETNRGLLSRIGVELKQAAVRMSAGIAVGLPLSDSFDYKVVIASAGVAAASGFLASLIKAKRKGAQVVWKSLLAHGRNLSDELRHSQELSAKQKVQADAEFWGIPEKPSMKLFVTGGTIIMDSIVPEDTARTSDKLTGSPDNPYGLCPCFSGRKYQFCCKGLERASVKKSAEQATSVKS